MDRFLHKGTLRWWRRTTRRRHQGGAAAVAAQMRQAGRLRRERDTAIEVAGEGAILPGASAMDLPRSFDTDWTWRPDLWRAALAQPGIAPLSPASRLSDDIEVFHDCASLEALARQCRNRDPEDTAPYGLHIDVFGFTGSFLAVSADIPAAGSSGLSPDHLLRLETRLEMETDTRAFARLNLEAGPNMKRIVRDIDHGSDRQVVEFDLFEIGFDDRRLSKAWVEIILQAPRMTQAKLRDLTLSRRLRAAM